ncbi:Type 1 glutamine amidotransferase-like domain-containing protein [Agrococcus sp. KRD186]|uniref:Type 1 glutamine amidotransferase-like domain-containing protein n=1 Tax=Agrococcus sp. KRD186 TaxID=2729730 RepID=UPI0019D00564|nr:Type 1 glutamine amidotransferase-like domain-containing protein [Agrococcus sp. KRD186]
MKFLLTSNGVTNASIRDALERLLGKPIAESSALLVPTGAHPFPGGPAMARSAIAGTAEGPLAELGWASLGVLELTALPTVRREHWEAAVREADALLVWGGDVLYLVHWMRESGLAELLPALADTVYVGVSAGSITVTPWNCDAEFDLEFVPEGSDMGRDAERALGLVDVAIYPHLDRPGMEDAALESIERWAAGIPAPTYAIDDDSALVIADGAVEVVSEGSWRRLEPRH